MKGMSNMKKSILIVEGEESIIDILTYSLRKEGFIVHTAMTGEQALEKFQGIDIHLVILDIMQPDTTGFELCKQLTSISNIPILMLTTRNDIVDKVLGLELEDTLLVAGGQDEEGIWTPSYKLSPDKTKILFDTPVQVGEEYKTNVYAAEIKGGTLNNATRLIENGDLFAVISLAGAWSDDSKTAYIHTYHKDNFTFNTVEKFMIK